MKYLQIIFLLFIGNLAFSQTPEPYFLYFYEWGEGGQTNLSFKVDQVSSVEITKDGYLFDLRALCLSGRICHRYQKIDFEGNVQWEYDFNNLDTSFIGTSDAQENWVIDDKFYTLSRATLQGNERLLQYAIFDVDSGELEKRKLYLGSDLGLRGLGYFYPYQDSLFIFGQSHEVEEGRDVPAFRFMNRAGEIVGSVDANSYFDDNNTLTTHFKENATGDFNIITVQRDYFSTEAGFLYTGTCSSNGQKKTHFATGDHTAGGYPREVTFDNGNRFLVAGIDTLWDDLFEESNFFKTYYLKPNGEIIKDSLYHFGDTTYYMTDVMLCENGDALILGNARTDLIITDDDGAIFLMRVNPQGEIIWHKKYSPFLFSPSSRNFVKAMQIEEDWDNGILIVGNVSRLLDPVTDERERTGFLLKLDQNGCYGADCNGGNILLSNKAPIPITLLPKVNIYPNPASDFLQITTTSKEEYTWRLYNSQGQIIQQDFQTQRDATSINTGHLHNGTYFLQIQFTNGVVNKQVLILR